MRKTLLIAWLRLCAFVLDRLGRRHSIRRRLGQLRRARKSPELRGEFFLSKDAIHVRENDARKPEALEVQQ